MAENNAAPVARFAPKEAGEVKGPIVDPPASKDTVLMMFPKKVRITTQSGQVYDFNPGPRNVPIKLDRKPDGKGGFVDVHPDEHWYLKVNGVTPYDGSVPMRWNKEAIPEVTQKHVAFLNAHGYKIADVQGAKTFVENLDGRDVHIFFSQAAVWNPEPVAQTAAEAGKPAASSTSTDDPDDEVNLNKMKKADLLAYAKEKHDLTLDESLTNADIVKAIEARAEQEK